jgi:hypothetical protein
MAVLQCACYCSNPKAMNELAVNQIARYLLKMKTHGLILCPTTDLSLNLFVNADFAGRWHKEYSELWDSVLCRIWCSNLQSKIAFSTTEVNTLLFLWLPMIVFL